MEEDNTKLPPKHSRGAEGESTSEIPAKQRKKGDAYQAFGPEETEQLKNYNIYESQTRQIVNRTYKKLFNSLSGDDTDKEINYLKERLSTLKNKTSLDPICIGFLGQTGVGKTSLLNAILGKKQFLPMSGSRVCTSCVVKVTVSRANRYEATIHLLSDNEWKEEMKKLVEVLNEDDEDDVSDDECEKDATEKLCVLYGVGADKKDFEALSKTKMKVTVPPSGKITIKEEEVKKFSEELEPYVRVRYEKTPKLWPLIKYVEVTIPGSDILPEGIVFFDMPGTGDLNSKRDEMWKESINECGVIWIISAAVRVEGGRDQKKFLDESIKACIGGICNDIALVVTKCDVLNLEEYRRERRNKDKPVENEHDAILERNEDVKIEKERSIKEKLKKRLPPDSEILKSKLVYTVSIKEFWKSEHLSKEETEIPELREYIRKIYLKEKQKLVTDYVTEVRSICRLANNFGSEPQPEDLMFHGSGVEKEIMNDVDSLENVNSLEKDLEKCFGKIDKCLSEGVDQARKNCKKTVENLLRDKGARGFHKTLKAVCLKDGVYASRSFSRINFNESLAELIHSKTDCIFDCIFRTQRGPQTRSCLWSCLAKFKGTVQKKIHQIGEKNHLLNNSKIDLFIRQVNVIVKQLEKGILQKKSDIYESLSESIQSDLKPYYENASKVKGRGAYEEMKKILKEGIEKEVTKNKLFEKAKSKMQSKFEELAKYIMLKLKGDISIAFNLVFLQEGRTAVHLPDIEKECREIEEIYDKLLNDS